MNGINQYDEFLEGKRQINNNYGFDPIIIPQQAFDFQRSLIRWAIKKGRCGIFAATLQQVGAVQGEGVHMNSHLARARFRRGNIADFEDFGAARPGDDSCFHV